MERKVPIYGPYLQVLFEVTWAATFEAESLPVGPLTAHDEGQLRIKDNWVGGHGPAHDSPPPAGSDEEVQEEPEAGGGSIPRTRSGASFGAGGLSSSQGP